MYKTAALALACAGLAAGCGDDAPASPPAFTPTTVTLSDADATYDSWKSRFLEDCGGGLWRVKWSTATLTVSEGIGYGMLLTVAHDEQPIFDGLWQYYKNNRDGAGLMNWQRSGCEGAPAGNNAATDADLDTAMALVMASHRWSATPYLADAQALIGAIQAHETVIADDGLAILRPGDVFGGQSCLNFSYFAPGYYRAFAQVEGTDAAFWNKLADDTYTVLGRAANTTTGLVPNWCDEQGQSTPAGPDGCANYTFADEYGSDAARTPWRIATDFVWWRGSASRLWLERLTGWVKSVGIANVGGRYALDGTATATNHSVVLVGAFADAALAHDQETADAFFQELSALPPSTGYYSSSLRALYLLLPVGRFTPGGGI
jgi:endo-1,4-beta-D-glucanase Y